MKKSNLILGCAALALIAAVFVLVYTQLRPATVEGEKNITVSVIADGETVRTVSINTDAEYLREALESENLIQGDESEYGLYITTVDNITADWNAGQSWWCLTKGGEDVFTGVDTTPIEDGDHFELTLTIG